VEEDYESTRFDSLQQKKNDNKIIDSGTSGLGKDTNDPLNLILPELESTVGDSSTFDGNNGVEGNSAASGDGGRAENYNNERVNDSQDFNRGGKDGEMYGGGDGGDSADEFHYKDSRASTDVDPNSYHYKDSVASEDGSSLRYRDSASVDANQESEFGSNFGKGFGNSGDGGEGNYNSNNEINDFSFHQSNDGNESGNGEGNGENNINSQDAFRFNNPSGDFGEHANNDWNTGAGKGANTNAITHNSGGNLLGNGGNDGAETSSQLKNAEGNLVSDVGFNEGELKNENHDQIGIDGGESTDKLQNGSDSVSAMDSENNTTISSNLASNKVNEPLLVVKQERSNNGDFPRKNEIILSNPQDESKIKLETKQYNDSSVESDAGYIRGRADVNENIAGEQSGHDRLGASNIPAAVGNEGAGSATYEEKSGGLRGYPVKRDMNKELHESKIALTNGSGNDSFSIEEKSPYADNGSAGNDSSISYEGSLQSNRPAINNTALVSPKNITLSKLGNRTISEGESSVNKLRGSVGADVDKRYPVSGSDHELNSRISGGTGTDKIESVNLIRAVDYTGSNESNEEPETGTYQGSRDSYRIQHQTLEIPQADDTNDGNIGKKKSSDLSSSLVGNSDATLNLNDKELVGGKENSSRESVNDDTSTKKVDSPSSLNVSNMSGQDTVDLSMQKIPNSMLSASDIESKSGFANNQSNQEAVSSNNQVSTQKQLSISSPQDYKSGSTHGVEIDLTNNVDSKNSTVVDVAAKGESSNSLLDLSNGNEATYNKTNVTNNAVISNESSLVTENEIDAKNSQQSPQYQGVAGTEVENVQSESIVNIKLNNTSLQINPNSTKIGTATLANATKVVSEEFSYTQQVENTISDGVGKPDANVDDERQNRNTTSNGNITKEGSEINEGSNIQTVGNVTNKEAIIQGGNSNPDVTIADIDETLPIGYSGNEASEENSTTSTGEGQTVGESAQPGLPEPSNLTSDNGAKAEIKAEKISNVASDDLGRSFTEKESFTNEHSIDGGDSTIDTSKGSANLSAMLQEIKEPPEIAKLDVSLGENESNKIPLEKETTGNELSPISPEENSFTLSEGAKSEFVGNDEISSIAKSDTASDSGNEEDSIVKNVAKVPAAADVDTENVGDKVNKNSVNTSSQIDEQSGNLSMERRGGGDTVENHDSIPNGDLSDGSAQ